MLFSGKNIIVTGATGDLGTAITQRLIAQGANVLAVAIKFSAEYYEAKEQQASDVLSLSSSGLRTLR